MAGERMTDPQETRRSDRRRAVDRYLTRAESPLKLLSAGGGTTTGWFLGPKAENEALFLELISDAITSHAAFRRTFHPDDPDFITETVKRSSEYQDTVAGLKKHTRDLCDALQMSTPLFSMRHQGHMLWDQALPATVGYFAAMLYDQNNVAAEASPVTTHLEIEVGNDLCRMLGFRVPKDGKPKPGEIVPWGHITCDGSVANIEGLWAARNAKFYPVALGAALRESPLLEKARDLMVPLLDGSEGRLRELEPWTLLNLKIDDVVALPQRISDEFGIPASDTTQALVAYSLQQVGMVQFYQRFLPGLTDSPVVLAPATRHYSWQKAAALLGLGQNNLWGVEVDKRARMNVAHLDDLLRECLRKHIPVAAVVAVIGSTEESAVDPLKEILELRESYRRRGLDFSVHCDAAWGGYFNSMRHDDNFEEADIDAVPTYPMSRYVLEQYRSLKDADSITVDPHKAGYAPYPAGGLCYRNSALRDVISLKAPVIFHNQSEPTVGIYGVEGSKPGAAAAAVYLAHRVIRPTRSGYGKILGQCMWTSKRLYCHLATLEDERFKLTLMQELPAELAGDPKKALQQRAFIREKFVSTTNEQLEECLKEDKTARELFMELGSDQTILAYSVNFYTADGKLNQDVDALNTLNDKVFENCSITIPPTSQAGLDKIDLILTSSSFDPALYGQAFVDHYGVRLGLKMRAGAPINFLISTTMNPWTTDTPQGDFLNVVVGALKNAVYDALGSMGGK